MLVERMLKTEENVHVVLFSSVDEEAAQQVGVGEIDARQQRMQAECRHPLHTPGL